MISVIHAIREFADADDGVCVFPSEVAAAHLRRKLADIDDARAIRSDRLISWDTFKERYLTSHSELKPVNRLIRRLFAARLCSENSDQPFLGYLIPESYAPVSSRFAAFISTTLPHLKRLCADIDADRLVVTSQARRDFDALLDEYGRFLEKKGIFEPAFASENNVEVSTMLCFPELADDFARYEYCLQNEKVRRLDPPRKPRYSVSRFENTLLEIDWLCSRILDLLSGGAHPTDIVISVAGLEAVAGFLLESARIRNIPLDVRAGVPLARTAAGRMFESIRNCVRSGYDLDTFKALLLDPRVPWINRDINRRLAQFGVAARCGRNSIRDVWLERLQLYSESRLAGYYRSLRNSFTSILRTTSFRDLKTEVIGFVNTFLNTRILDARGVRSFQAVLESFEPLIEAESVVGEDLKEKPYGLWLEYLADRLYVEPASEAGVSVYPYRVTAGIYPGYHFVVNTAHSATRIASQVYPFLPPNAYRTKEIDRSALFIRAYASSGTSVHFSESRTGPDGSMLTPTEFLFDDVEHPDSSSDPYSVERRFWSGAAPAVPPAPDAIFPVQRFGYFKHSIAANESDRVDLTHAVCSDDKLIADLAGAQNDEESRIVITATSLDAWNNCPFRYLFSRVLKVNEARYEVSCVDPMLEGQVLHGLLARLFQYIIDDLDGVAPSANDHGALIGRLLSELESPLRFPQPAPLLLDERLHLFRMMLANCLDSEAAIGDARRVIEAEGDYEVLTEGIAFRGRIDRISRGDDGFAIVDYKRTRTPKKSDLVDPSDATTYQLPLYTYFVENLRGGVSDAVYFSLTDGVETPVFSTSRKKSWLSREDLDALIAAALELSKKMAAAVHAGDYRVRKRSGGCDACGVRPICRQRYVVS